MRKSSLSCSRGFAFFWVRVADGFALQQKVTLSGLEPAIFGSEAALARVGLSGCQAVRVSLRRAAQREPTSWQAGCLERNTAMDDSIGGF